MLVFGGNSALCEVLIQQLSDVAVVKTAGRQKCDFIVDITSSNFHKSISFKPDVVINLCTRGCAGSNFSISELLLTNVVGAARIAEYCISINAKQFVHFSSIYAKLSRDSPFYGPYSFSKAFADESLLFHAAVQELPLLILRPGPIYGDSDRLLTGQPLLSSVLTSAAAGRDIVLYGKHDASRYYIHSFDVCKAVCLAVRKKVTGLFDVMPMSSSTLSYIGECARTASTKPCTVIFNKDKPDVHSLNVEFDHHLYDVLNYRPTIELQTGIEREVIRMRMAL